MPPLVFAAAFVLTGGQSRRMGRDKALLPVAGQLMVVRTAKLLRPLAAQVALVGEPERYGHLGLPVLPDCQSGRGPLAGIVTALRATESDWNLIVACDLPYLETGFLRFLLEQVALTPDSEAVVPQTDDGWQPLCGAYHRRCLPAFEKVLAEGNPKIVRAFEQLRVRAVGAEELRRFAFSPRMFKNMNTLEDYAEAQRILGV